MSVTKRKKKSGKGVAIFFIVFIILEGLLIFGLSRVFKNKDVTPSIAGYSMYIMDGDAMGDAVPKGSLVIAANGAPSVEGIKKAVLAEEVPGVGTSVFWLADVTTSTDLQGVVYKVFQEKNPTKIYELTTKNIVGTATSYYQTAGKIITFMTSKFGIIALLAAPLFLLVLIELIIMIINHTSDDDEDEDEDEDDDTEQPVKLDDFLFGGEGDKKMIEDSVNRAEEAGRSATKNSTKAPKASGTVKSVRSSGPDFDDDLDLAAAKAEKERRKAAARARAEAEAAAMAAEQEADKPVKAAEKSAAKAEETVKETVTETVSKASDEVKPTIDPSYYEKASRLIDGSEAESAPAEEAVKETVKEAVKPAKAPEKKPAEAPKPKTTKNVTAGFEDLMKLVEAESTKLRNQMNDDKK
ncbi:MAG: hypothetical protein IKP47_00605 [Ruminococcus sp.]|nr:hypothetical protein [Ruminococcus sp.]